MTPGLYIADIHDRFSLEIKDSGWEERKTSPEGLQDEEPTLQLNRIADTEQRVIIDTGPTGPSLSDTQLLPDLTSLQVSPPMPVTVGGTTGFQVDLAPSKSADLNVPVIPDAKYELAPGHTYRLIVTQRPMDQESGVKLILISAPTSSWEAFSPLADGLVQTLRFD
jgi:hypothetical protein